MGGVGLGNALDPKSIVVAESRWQTGILFGFLTLIFAVALARGLTGAQTTAGRVAIIVFCGVFIALFLRGGIVILRKPARLEITADAIRLLLRNGLESTLSRESGDELRFDKHHAGPLSRVWTLRLTVAGTSDFITLTGFFSRSEVRQACQAAGWGVAN